MRAWVVSPLKRDEPSKRELRASVLRSMPGPTDFLGGRAAGFEGAGAGAGAGNWLWRRVRTDKAVAPAGAGWASTEAVEAELGFLALLKRRTMDVGRDWRNSDGWANAAWPSSMADVDAGSTPAPRPVAVP